MENKMYELMEKMYEDFTSFRAETASRLDKVEQNMATKDNIKDMATKDDIKGMATKDDIKGLQEDINRIEFKLENETNDKIRALFDHRVIVNEKFDELNERLNDIQIDLNSLTCKVIKSDTQIIEIKRNLKEVK